MNRAQMAQAIFDLKADGTAEWREKLCALAGHLTLAEFKEVMAVVKDMRQEEIAKCEAEAKRAQDDAELMDRAIAAGAPKDVRFYQACELMAARGDPLAAKHLERMNSKGSRLGKALCRAAMEAHPAFERTDEEGVWKVHGAHPFGDGDTTALVEWFQTTYPQRARAIERQFED